MLKKFFALILISSIFNSNAFIDEHLAQLSNPTQKYFANLDLCGVNLSGFDLNNCTFEKVKFNGANLTETNFYNSIFIECNFVDTIFDEIIIANAHFELCNMQKVYMLFKTYNSAYFDQKSSEGIIFVD